MKPFTVTLDDGTVYNGNAPDDATKEQVLSQAQARWYREKGWKKDPNPFGVVPEGFQQPAKDPMRPLKVLVGMQNPETLEDYVALATMTAIPIAGAGELAAQGAARLGMPLAAKAAPYVGRAVASGAISAGQTLMQGKDAAEAMWHGVVDSLVGLGIEGGLGALRSSVETDLFKLGKKKLPLAWDLERWAKPAQSYRWATQAPHDALQKIVNRLPPGRHISLPMVDPTRKFTPQEAIEALVGKAGESKGGLMGKEYQAARKKLAEEFNRLDAYNVTQPGAQRAGDLFTEKGVTARMRRPPGVGASLADLADRVLGSRAGRSAVQAVGIAPTPDESGTTLGELGAVAAGQRIRHPFGGGHERSEESRY